MSKIQPGQSLEPLRAVVQRFGALAGMPFLQLDENGAAAVQLESGQRLELEYVATADRLLLHVEVPGPVPEDPRLWSAVAKKILPLMAGNGFSLGLGQVEGRDRLLALASLPAALLDAEDLGETALQLVDTARAVGDRLAALAAQRDASPDLNPMGEAGFFRV